MTDMFTRKKRSEIMRRIKSTDTVPEKDVRHLLHAWGYRFRLHRKDLPGCPDVILPKYKLAVLVHGCFWHGHACQHGRRPRSNTGYWKAKINKNKTRDASNRRRLSRIGWRTLVIWECETRDPDKIARRVRKAIRVK